MNLAGWLMVRATGLMPVERQAWAEAMRQEFEAVAPADRLGFAAGCLWAAMRERIDAMQMGVTIGRWGVGLVTAAYGALHLFGAISVLNIMLTGHDHYRDLLLAHGHTEAAAQLQASRPGLVLYLVLMAAGNLVAALFLVRWRPRLFWLGCAIVAVTAGVPAIYGMAKTGLDTGTVWGWQFVPLAMLAGAAVVLAWMSRRKPGGMAAA